MLYLSPGEMYEFRSLVKHEQDPTCAPGHMATRLYYHDKESWTKDYATVLEEA